MDLTAIHNRPVSSQKAITQAILEFDVKIIAEHNAQIKKDADTITMNMENTKKPKKSPKTQVQQPSPSQQLPQQTRGEQKASPSPQQSKSSVATMQAHKAVPEEAAVPSPEEVDNGDDDSDMNSMYSLFFHALWRTCFAC